MTGKLKNLLNKWEKLSYAKQWAIWIGALILLILLLSVGPPHVWFR